jgi:CubicO group peptidase (beta-lactamase class C family)
MTNIVSIGRICFGAIVLLQSTVTHADQFDVARTQIHNSMAAENIPSVAVAVARNGQIIWEEGFGWSDVEKRIPATAHTPYSLASISKSVTATALMILVKRGAVELDRPLNDYLGAQKLTAHIGDARDATVRRVANHTSGLSEHYQFFYEDELAQRPPMDESIRRYGVLMHAPGELFSYSNFGYGLLEYIIERQSGKTYAQFLQDELFSPLGLKESGVNHSADFGVGAAARYRAGQRVPFYDFDHRGASAVYMSAHDLVRFGMFHLNEKLDGQRRLILDQVALASMRDDPVSTPADFHQTSGDYALGWIVGKKHGLTYFGHTGGMAGVRTQLALYPDARLAIAILANGEGTDVHGKIESSIVHSLLPETIHADTGFRPLPGLIGGWKGAVQTYNGQVPVGLEFKENGSVFAAVGGAPLQEVTSVERDPSTSLVSLNNLSGDLGTPDAGRHPYQLKFSLELQMPDLLYGAATAVSEPMLDRSGNALSYWVELHRVRAGQD